MGRTMKDPELDGPDAPDLLRRVRLDNDAVVPPDAQGPGATAIDRRIVRAARPGATGLELLAEQRAWNMAYSADPAAVPQGPHLGQSPQLPRLVVILLAMVGLAGGLWLLRTLSWLIAPMFFALNLVIVVYPVQTFLRRRGCPKALAIALTGLTLVAVLTVLILVSVWAVSEMIGTTQQYIPEMTLLYDSALDWLVSRGVEADPIAAMLSAISPSSLLGALPGVFSSFSSLIAVIGVVLSAVIMMMLDVPSWGRRVAAAGSTHPRAVAAMREFSLGVRRYWLVSTLFGAIMATLNYIQLAILGVPLPLVWALLTWLMTYVPSVGFFFSLIPPLVVALVANGWQTAAWLLAVYFVTTWIVQGILQPKFTGNAVGVNATVALLSLLLWAWVFGPLGALIALPCTLFVKALLVDADPKARWVNSLLASEPDVRGAAGQS
ncbi:AI-2E family transporter [Brooklawnia cerclae]|uniref:PurR-regulated permease PerM n=1 Tax=Brooklawnia cerclae TaxID=349934 RepID=A0ABX0SJN0_9ACTN|nr:AI-2E family transporter [Brooklawnia cerclae]NIH57240.1 putative PurR-regulated permease PerM [Brooklawnia cerclae]